MSDSGNSRLKLAGGIAAVVAVAVVGTGIATRAHSERTLSA